MGNWLGLPINASDHGDKVDQIINYMHVLMFLIFIGWGAFFIYTLIRFRKKKNPVADYDGVKKHTSTYVEAAIVVAEIVFLVGFSIPFWAAEVDAFPDPEMDPFEVRVLGMQFAWVSHYPGPDKVFGKTSPDLVDDEEENYIGLDASDPAAADDIVTYGELMLPQGPSGVDSLDYKRRNPFVFPAGISGKTRCYPRNEHSGELHAYHDDRGISRKK